MHTGLPTVPRLMETAQRLLAVAERRTQYEDGDDSDEIIGAASGDDGAWPPPVRAALQVCRSVCNQSGPIHSSLTRPLHFFLFSLFIPLKRPSATTGRMGRCS